MRKIILTTMVLMLLSSVGHGADWKYYGTDAIGSVEFYDTQSVSRGENTIKVWDKTVLSDKDKKEYIKRNPNTPNIEKINYIKDRWEINCLKNNFRLLSCVWFSSDGDVIDTTNFPNPQINEIVPDSMMEILAKTICK